VTPWAAVVAATWLGLMTSVSPCPLATNMAAVSFLARRLESRRRAVMGVLAYAGGRALAYAIVGALVAWGIAAAPQTSAVLQRYLEPFVGPLLIMVGLVLLGWIPLRVNFGPARPGATESIADRGLPGAFLLGALFALTFCPTSAALFFGSLLPVALTSPTQLPLFVIYGFATAVPVGIVALAVLVGANSGARLVGGIQRWQGPLQTVNAWLIVAIGAYLTLSGSLRIFQPR
jgi:cytochrome c biogenesis protein CcdA